MSQIVMLVPLGTPIIFAFPDRLPERIQMKVYEFPRGELPRDELVHVLYYFADEPEPYNECLRYCNSREAAFKRIGELYPNFEHSRVEINVCKF